MHFSLQRPAIAMIELIFAIVVMGIVMMSAPQLLSTASKSGYVAIQQEGINEAATQVNMILDYPWDENDTNASRNTVLVVSNGDSELDANKSSGAYNERRAGTPKNSTRLFYGTGGVPGGRFNASVISNSDNGDDAGEDANKSIHRDDIDDFNGTSVNLVLDGAVAGASDYIEKGNKINIARTVNYMNDTASYNDGGGAGAGGTLTFNPFNNKAGTTNIKHIQVTLTSTSGVAELDKTITLHAFSCNIGTYKLEER